LKVSTNVKIAMQYFENFGLRAWLLGFCVKFSQTAVVVWKDSFRN